jgi:hypothetical protein
MAEILAGEASPLASRSERWRQSLARDLLSESP